ncbi:TetR/AcrR family transcriptional regulator [Streptomyces sp. NPDC091292]|uniref:TetR/AcrR family transcriptional regulator n=1 Tax=Streptomyces sp. NPDC091292 TaxID=3365991 RepID=UPI0037FEA43C
MAPQSAHADGQEGSLRAGPAAADVDLTAWRRLQLIGAASEVICRNGVDGARLKDIAQEAGVSLGMVQHYFRRREELISETISSMLELTLATWRSVSEREPDPVRRLFALLRFQVAGWAPFSKRWSFWIEFWSAANRDATLHTYAQDVYQRWEGPFRIAIEAGVKTGDFRAGLPADRLSLILMSLADGAAVHVLMAGDSFGEESMFDLLIDMACRILGIEDEVRDRALSELPRIISPHYPEEPEPGDGIDWSPLMGQLGE